MGHFTLTTSMGLNLHFTSSLLGLGDLVVNRFGMTNSQTLSLKGTVILLHLHTHAYSLPRR